MTLSYTIFIGGGCLPRRKMGAPVKYTKERIAEIKKAMELYIEENDLPIVAEFAYKNDVDRARLYEISDLSDTMKRLISKKEAQLEKLASFNVINATMAVFSLKQLGWRDKQDVAITTPEGIKVTWE